MDRGRIIVDPSGLEESYVPDVIPQRLRSVEKLVFCLSPALERKSPIHVWLHGKPGAGKTTTARYFLSLIRRQHQVEGLYVNCWECTTLFSILDRLILELRILGAEKPDARFKLERLRRYMGEKPFILVLDEIDCPAPKERNAILYNLCALSNLGLICISYSRIAYFELDDRVKSRLSPYQIQLDQYPLGDLLSILRERAERTLVQGSWTLHDLRTIAEISKGDLRVAIQTLKNAAYWSQEEGLDSLDFGHIQSSVQQARKLKRKYLLRKLTRDHRILYGLVRERREVLSGDLWSLYLGKCEQLDTTPIAPRTYSMYMNRLRDIGLVSSERAKVRGKVRVFRSVE